MRRLHVDDEIARLDVEIERLLGNRGGAEALPRLADRLGVRPPPAGTWTRRLSPLVVLYPLAQSEGLAGVPNRLARQATVGHVLLLVWIFADDRQVDRQIRLEGDLSVLADTCLLEGLDVLLRLGGDRRELWRETRRTLLRYREAQTTSYGEIPVTGREQRLRSIVAGRAAPGFLATRALARGSGVSGGQLADFKRAYDRLALGLQWEDDLQDWPHDLSRGQENLVLDLLARSPSRDVLLTGTLPEVEGRLIADGIYAEAFRRLSLHLEAAARAQERLGCGLLAALIRAKLKQNTALEEDLLREAGLALSRDRADPQGSSTAASSSA